MTSFCCLFFSFQIENPKRCRTDYFLFFFKKSYAQSNYGTSPTVFVKFFNFIVGFVIEEFSRLARSNTSVVSTRTDKFDPIFITLLIDRVMLTSVLSALVKKTKSSMFTLDSTMF